MKQFLQNMLNKEGYVMATLFVSGLMAAAGLAGDSPFLRIAVVITLYNVLAAYWYSKLWESVGPASSSGGKDENPS